MFKRALLAAGCVGGRYGENDSRMNVPRARQAKVFGVPDTREDSPIDIFTI